MNRLGTSLHIHANLPNIIISQSVFLKEGAHIGGHCLTCKISVIAARKNEIATKAGPYASRSVFEVKTLYS